MRLAVPFVAVAAASLLVGYGATTSSFPALDRWISAINSGDAPALRQMYVLAYTHLEPGGIQQEVSFWASLKSSGFVDVRAKILSQEQQNGRTVLVLRVYASKNGQPGVCGMSQLWQQANPGGWQLVAWQRSEFGLDAGRSLPEPAKPNPTLYGPPSDARLELQRASARAAAEHKRVLVVFGANWCYDCHVLDATFHSPSFAPLVSKNYVVVHVNTGDEGKDNNDLAKQYGVPIEGGIPNLAILDPSGHVVVAQHGEFKTTTKIGPADVRAFLEKWKPAGH